MELVRNLALSFADDGKRVKVLYMPNLHICKRCLSVCIRLPVFVGLCARVDGRRSSKWNATSACWNSEDFGDHGLGP